MGARGLRRGSWKAPGAAAPAAICLAAGALGIALGAAGQPTPRFRGAVDLVPIAVTVTGRGGIPVVGLPADAFEILEDGRPQTIAYFARGDVSQDETARPALHLGILLDTSQSMQDDVAFTRTAAIKFLNRLQEAVDITVVDFDTEVRTARYTQADFPRVVERIRRQKVRGMTALYDAIGTYLDGAAGQRIGVHSPASSTGVSVCRPGPSGDTEPRTNTTDSVTMPRYVGTRSAGTSNRSGKRQNGGHEHSSASAWSNTRLDAGPSTLSETS